MDTRETRQTVPPNGRGNPAADAAPAVKGETTPERREGNPRVRRIAFIAGGIVAVLVLIWGINWLLYARTHQTTDDAKVDADTIAATSKISERVANVLVDTGQYVHKGQLLIQLDDRDELSRLLQARAAVSAQRATAAAAQENVTLVQQTQSAQAQESSGAITQAQSTISNASADIAAAQAAVTQAQAAVPAARSAYQTALADYNRTSALVRSGDLAQQELDRATSNLSGARSQYQGALAEVANAQARLAGAQAGTQSASGSLETAQGKLAESTAPARVASASAQANAQFAQVGSLQAQAQLAQDQYNDTKIVSPVDGYVGEKDVEVGQTVAPGVTLMTIIPSQNLYVTANYKETQVGNMRPGQPVDISIDTYKGVRFHGHVDSINPAAQSVYSLVPPQNATGNFIKVTQRIPVKISIDGPQGYPLRPGMSVETSVKVR